MDYVLDKVPEEALGFVVLVVELSLGPKKWFLFGFPLKQPKKGSL